NVEKAMQHKVFESEEIRNIYTALGVTIGTEEDSKALNLSKLRCQTNNRSRGRLSSLKSLRRTVKLFIELSERRRIILIVLRT
ncbi:hypothetical protein CLI75_12130, partial [Porphyromonas gingivalis]|uniref:hypothetical protein n=1 Tax=Porphyromonas gingivalis TaxID=837 RepID=UPI000BE75D98